MSERRAHSSEDPGTEEKTRQEREETTDLGYRDTVEERAYEQAESGSEPSTSSEPEPGLEPPDAG